MKNFEKYIVNISVLHMDEYFSTSKWPKEGDKTIMTPGEKVPGGSVSNAACVSSTLGARVFFYDVLSKSDTNKYLLEDLEKYGVNTEYVNFTDNLIDSKCLIISTPCEKTILGIIHPKPSIPLSDSHLHLFNNAEYIYGTLGFYYFIPDAYKNFNNFKKSGAKLALDVEFGARDKNDTLILESANILFFNEFGFSANRKNLSEEEYLEYLLNKGVEYIVITLGKRGCKVITKSIEFEFPAYDVEVVDTNGAGDTFNGAFLYGLIRDWQIENITKFALGASAYCVTQKGARGGAVSETTIQNFMNSNNN